MMVDSISTTIDPKFNDYALVGFPRSESAAPLDYSIGLGLYQRGDKPSAGMFRLDQRLDAAPRSLQGFAHADRPR